MDLRARVLVLLRARKTFMPGGPCCRVSQGTLDLRAVFGRRQRNKYSPAAGVKICAGGGLAVRAKYLFCRCVRRMAGWVSAGWWEMSGCHLIYAAGLEAQ